MKSLKQVKKDLVQWLNEQDGTLCDYETCKYRGECELDNPDFDASYCKVN